MYMLLHWLPTSEHRAERLRKNKFYIEISEKSDSPSPGSVFVLLVPGVSSTALGPSTWSSFLSPRGSGVVVSGAFSLPVWYSPDKIRTV